MTHTLSIRFPSIYRTTASPVSVSPPRVEGTSANGNGNGDDEGDDEGDDGSVGGNTRGIGAVTYSVIGAGVAVLLGGALVFARRKPPGAAAAASAAASAAPTDMTSSAV